MQALERVVINLYSAVYYCFVVNRTILCPGGRLRDFRRSSESIDSPTVVCADECVKRWCRGLLQCCIRLFCHQEGQGFSKGVSGFRRSSGSGNTPKVVCDDARVRKCFYGIVQCCVWLFLRAIGACGKSEGSCRGFSECFRVCR